MQLPKLKLSEVKFDITQLHTIIIDAEQSNLGDVKKFNMYYELHTNLEKYFYTIIRRQKYCMLGFRSA